MFSTWKSVNYDDFNKRSFLMEQSVQISSNTFWGTPFLEKGPPKITEGGPFDPRWLISKINPAYRIQLCTKNIQSNCCTVKKDVFFCDGGGGRYDIWFLLKAVGFKLQLNLH